MGRWRDDERIRRNRTRSYDGGSYDRRGRGEGGYGQHGYGQEHYHNRYDDDRYAEDRYYRDPDREREYYYRERGQRHETRRTGMMVLGAIAVAIIALIGVVAVTGGEDSFQTAQQPVQPQQPAQPQQPQAPAVPQQPDGASSEQVEGMRADLERQLAEIRQSINQLRLEIWSLFAGQQSGQQEQEQQ